MIKTSAGRGKLVLRLLVGVGLAILLFGFVYYLLGRFTGHGVKSEDGLATLAECFYFSVVTLCTLGYGDFSPLGWSRVVAGTEAIFGFAYFGYAVAQFVTLKQESQIDYLANSTILHTYDQCLRDLTDSKELIRDRRREAQNHVYPDVIDFLYSRSNPFYPSLKAFEILYGYTSHLAAVMRLEDMSERLDRAATHIEELLSITRKYLNILNNGGVDWNQPRTKEILIKICELADSFVDDYFPHTRFRENPYKGSGEYPDVVASITGRIRDLANESTI